MGKIVLFVVIAVAAFLVWKGWGRARRRPMTREVPAELMVTCARCAVNLPLSEAIEDAGKYYCNEEHRRLGAA